MQRCFPIMKMGVYSEVLKKRSIITAPLNQNGIEKVFSITSCECEPLVKYYNKNDVMTLLISLPVT